MAHTSHRDEFGLESVEQFVEHAPIPIQRLAPDGTVLQANQALLDLLGYERDRYVGQPFGDFHTDPASGLPEGRVWREPFVGPFART